MASTSPLSPVPLNGGRMIPISSELCLEVTDESVVFHGLDGTFEIGTVDVPTLTNVFTGLCLDQF